MSQLVNAWDAVNLTFKFKLDTQHLNTDTPHIQGKHSEKWDLSYWSKILPQLQVMVTEVFTEVVYQRFPQINALCLFFVTHPVFQFQNCCSKKGSNHL